MLVSFSFPTPTTDVQMLPHYFCSRDPNIVNIWNRVLEETGTLGGYSNEVGVNSQVEKVIDDILESMGVRGKVTIHAEVEVMRNRPEFMLILVNGHPIGTIEGKQPGDLAAPQHSGGGV